MITKKFIELRCGHKRKSEANSHERLIEEAILKIVEKIRDVL